MKACVLEPKECINCGRCDDRCELDPKKLCDNCFRCLEGGGAEYLEIPITGIYTEDDYLTDEPHHQKISRMHVHTLSDLYDGRRLRR